MLPSDSDPVYHHDGTNGWASDGAALAAPNAHWAILIGRDAKNHLW